MTARFCTVVRGQSPNSFSRTRKLIRALTPIFFFERMPALELFHEERLDLGGSRALGAQRFGALPEVVGSAHLGGERLLLGLEHLDFAGQRLELAGFFVAELHPPGTRSLRFDGRGTGVNGGSGTLAQIIGVAA